MFTDLRHALRLFSRRPFFTAAILLTLALGIGANTAIFNLVRAVLLRPLPYHEPDRLVFALAQRVRATIGRTFDSRDTDAGTAVAVISDAFWRRRFGADAGIVGQTVDLIAGRGKNRTTSRHVVLGILPPAFRLPYPEETEVWAVMPWSRIRPSSAHRGRR